MKEKGEKAGGTGILISLKQEFVVMKWMARGVP